MVDAGTRFCAACTISNKIQSTITQGTFRTWISKFGPTKKFVMDNGREFCYNEMIELDASFANVENSGSHMEIFVMIEDKNANTCPTAWVSKIIKGVVKSSLAAETLALLKGAVLCFYINSQVECLQTIKQVDEKKFKIEIPMLKKIVERSEIRKLFWSKRKIYWRIVLPNMGVQNSISWRCSKLDEFRQTEKMGRMWKHKQVN
ncbi:unnamed protein product [Lepeophtheirus salmonis]|uniref:(salmon louse) hypothetical protein n=1 Tax=Lepeophtheirus salmonis TaxID=72036 RepID=A0A7R8CKG9_LEPSM|nr:unnamed protein product [Lepeophtheirus salmonis]CAF2820113.1 unnamed protein product [Lepeophtheirus salmonis]